MEIKTLRECRVELVISDAQILWRRDVKDILQLRNRRSVGVRTQIYSNRILSVNLEIQHTEVGKVVERAIDIVALSATNRTFELRTLIVEIQHDSIFILRIAETWANTVAPILAIILRGHLVINYRILIRCICIECILYLILILVVETIRETQLTRLRYRLVIGNASLRTILVSRRGYMLIYRRV